MAASSSAAAVDALIKRILGASSYFEVLGVSETIEDEEAMQAELRKQYKLRATLVRLRAPHGHAHSD